jgi:uncharacterized protein (DUF362 family)
MSQDPHLPPAPLNRRQFLQLLGLSGASAFLAGCNPFKPPVSTPPTATLAPAAGPTSTVLPSPTATAVPSYKSLVAIGQAGSYAAAPIRAQLQSMLEGIGGLKDLVKPGAHVGIKPNLTGGTWWDASLPAPAPELFVTHPALVGELVRLLYEAGAGKVTIMEGLGDARIYSQWGYTDMAAAVGAELVDLCSPAPYADFRLFPVGPTFQVYDSFYLNPILSELDLFISVAKMKCHATTGVTLSLKNLFGIAPIQFYRRHVEDNNRSAFHDTQAFDRRVPRVIVDLNLARPTHLALIDGIFSGDAGAGPWDPGLRPIRPGLLIASRDAVAADAVAASLMGFDPAAPSGSHPFTGGENHLALAAAAGLGTHDLSTIGVLGPRIQDVRFPFQTVG